MTQLDDLARRAVRALEQDAAALLRVGDALGQVHLRASPHTGADPDDATDDRGESRRTVRWAWAAGAVVAALVVGALVSGGPTDEPEIADDAPAATDAAPDDDTPVADTPVVVAGALTVPSDWNVSRYYVGGGITLTQTPFGFTVPAEEIGAIVRTTGGRLSRGTSGPTVELTSRSYIVTITDRRFGTQLTVAYAAGADPEELAPTVGERADQRIGDAVVSVAARGFDDDATVAALVLDGLQLAESQLLDRFDVQGGFDSVLQRSGTSGWVLEQGEASQLRTCLRLVAPDSPAPGGWNACFESDRNDLAYAVFGDRRFVLGYQADPQGPFLDVLMETGPGLPVFFEGWSGAVVREILPGARVASLNGVTGCAFDDVARSLGDPVVFQLVACEGGAASVVLRPGRPDDVAATVDIRQVDGQWVDPADAREPMYLGAGLSADVIPDEYRRPGGLLGGPFTMDAGGSTDSHAVTITSVGFRRPTTIQIGYVADGVPGAAFEGDVVAARRSADVTLWAASDDHDRGELQAIVDGLRLDLDRGADDGEPGEWGSLISSGAAARGWTEWRLVQGARTATETCIVLTEKVFGRRPPDAVSVCAPPDTPRSTTLVVRSANTYVIGLGVEDQDAAGAVVTLTDGSQQPTLEMRPSTEGGQVYLTVVQAGSRIDDVSWTEELGRACTFREMWNRLDEADGAGPLAVQVAGCELLLAAPADE